MRNAIPALAAILAVLVIVQPAAAAHTTVVSSHSTEAEFDAGALTNASTTANAVVYNPGEGSTVSREADSGTKSSNDQAKHGLRVDVKSDLDGLNITLSSNTGGATTAYITETDGTVISSASISGGQANISANLDAGQEYNVVVDAGGSSYNIGVDSFPNYPYTSNDVDILAGIEGTSYRSGQAYAVKTVEAWKTGSGDGEYISQNHTGSRITAGFANLTVTDAEAIVTWEGSNGGSWNQVATQTYTTDGNKSLDLSGTNYDTWRVNVTFVATGSSPSGKLYTEGIEFEARAPSVDNGSASPSGGSQIASSPTYEINVADGDFPTVQSDELTAQWYRNGTLLDTTTISGNGTASLAPQTSQAGAAQWHVEFTDDYGHTQTSDTFVYESPEELEIRNESNASELINGVDVTIEFYFPSATYTRNTTDGTVNMTGLPADQPFVVVAEAENYTNRRVYVPSLFETQTIYLLPTSAQSVSPEFELQDFSGDYPADVTVLEIQRVINGSWRTVEGDFFGATGAFPATLAYNQRHRLILTNTQTGESQNLGTYTPKTSTVQEITVYSDGDVTVAEGGVSATVVPSVRTLQSTAGQDVTATVRSPDDELSSWSVDVVLQNTSTGQNTTLNSTSSSIASGGNYTATMNLTNEAGNRIHVVVDYSTTDGVTGSKTVTYRIAKVYTDQFGLLQVLGGLGDHFPDRNVDMVLTLLAVVLSVLGMGAVSTLPGISTELVGLAGLLALGAFAVIGWITYGIVFAGAAGAATMVALRRVV